VRQQGQEQVVHPDHLWALIGFSINNAHRLELIDLEKELKAAGGTP